MVWLGLFWKQQLKKKTYFLQLLLLVLAMLAAHSLRLPDAHNLHIGYGYGQSAQSDWLAVELKKQNRELVFDFYGDTEELYADVMTGKVDCGFVLPVCMEPGAKVECVDSPFTTKASVAKLTLFAITYRMLSEQVLLDADQEIYASVDEGRIQELLQLNEDFLTGDEVFDVDVVEVHVDRRTGHRVSRSLWFQGLGGMFVMMMMFVAAGMIYDYKVGAVLLALSEREQRRMRALYVLAAGLLPAAFVYAFVLCADSSRGWAVEAVSLLLLMFETTVWTYVCARRRRPQELYYVWMIAFLLVQFLLCDLVFDLARYLPAVRFLRYFLPLGIYTAF